MSDLDLDSQAILNGLVYLDRHQQHHSNSAKSGKNKPGNASSSDKIASTQDAVNRAANDLAESNLAHPNGLSNPHAIAAAAAHYQGMDGPHAIAHLKVETGTVLKELARFRACDDDTMSCFYCREWSQWVYRVGNLPLC